MNNAIETKEYKGYTVNVYIDENADNPREWDNLSKMICFHKRYNLGDETELKSTDFQSWEELYNHIKNTLKGILIAPLYLYDHRGISIKIGSWIGKAQHAEWDSGQVGFVYITKEDIKKNWNVKKVTKKLIERAQKILESEVDIYDKYIRGECYGYKIEYNEKHIDSLWDFYDVEEAIKEAESNIDCYAKQEKELQLQY
jgi:hypothetical protein